MAVYKRGKKGMFYMNFTVNGLRVFRSTCKFTKKEAKLVEAVEKKKLMEEGAMSAKEKRARMRLSEAISKVYDDRWKNNKDGNGSRRNAEIVMELIGDMIISRIDEDVVAELVVKLEARGIEPGTVNRYLAALKTVLKYNKQAWDHIKLQKEPDGRIRVLTYREESMVIDLLRFTEHPPKRRHFYDVADLVEVLADTGCRLSEILFINYTDINFETNLLTSWFNKGDKPRSIPMTSRARAILLNRNDGRNKPFSLTIDQAEKAWSWVRRRMGLVKDKEFLLHALRHTCATRLVNSGIDLYIVKEWLGHSSITVTERYAHLNPMKLIDAAAVLELGIRPTITVDYSNAVAVDNSKNIGYHNTTTDYITLPKTLPH